MSTLTPRLNRWFEVNQNVARKRWIWATFPDVSLIHLHQWDRSLEIVAEFMLWNNAPSELEKTTHVYTSMNCISTAQSRLVRQILIYARLAFQSVAWRQPQRQKPEAVAQQTSAMPSVQVATHTVRDRHCIVIVSMIERNGVTRRLRWCQRYLLNQEGLADRRT